MARWRQFCCASVVYFCAGHLYAMPALARDCTLIASNLERLACFDSAAGTPVVVAPVLPAPFTRAQGAPVFSWVQANERVRQPHGTQFLMSVTEPHAGGEHVIISAPALGTLAPHPYLAISCESNISRLQLLTPQPLRRGSVAVQLFVDNQAVSSRRHWRVMEEGRLVEAGRGLPAVEIIKRLGTGNRIEIKSDHPDLHGLAFDGQGLHAMIDVERRACHW